MTENFLEICCYSLHSAKNAENGGADRIELCGGVLEGGITPSFGLIKEVLRNVNIPIFVMIRPRGGDFHYNDDELQTMLADIKAIKILSPGGFVFGCLDKNGNIDKFKCLKLLSLASPFPVTFHRAFDMSHDSDRALEDLITLGFKTVLTSGLCNKAEYGIENLKRHVEISDGRINILAGSGVNNKNIPLLLHAGVNGVHLSARYDTESEMIFRNPNVKMGLDGVDEYKNTESSFAVVREAKDIIEKLRKM